MRLSSCLAAAAALATASLFSACMPTPTGSASSSSRRTNGSTPGDFPEGEDVDFGTSPLRPDFGAQDFATGPADGGLACGTVTPEGACVAGSVRFCDNGTLVREDCTAQGKVCVVGLYGAMCEVSGGTPSDPPPPTSGGCGTVTFDGVCNGDLLDYCDEDNQKIITIDCAASGGCFVDPSGFASCGTI